MSRNPGAIFFFARVDRNPGALFFLRVCFVARVSRSPGACGIESLVAPQSALAACSYISWRVGKRWYKADDLRVFKNPEVSTWRMLMREWRR